MPAERTTDTLEASEELVLALFRTSLWLQEVYVSLLEATPDDAFPGEDPAAVLLEMLSGSACQAIEAAGLDVSRAATDLIAAVMERIRGDLRGAAAVARSGR